MVIDFTIASIKSGFVKGIQSSSEREDFISNVDADPSTIQKIASIKSMEDSLPEESPSPNAEKDIIRKIKAQNRKKLFGKWKDIRLDTWLLLFALFMILSFIVKPYFIQMLALSIICAFKWLLNTRAKRMKIDIVHKSAHDEDLKTGQSGIENKRQLPDA